MKGSDHFFLPLPPEQWLPGAFLAQRPLVERQVVSLQMSDSTTWPVLLTQTEEGWLMVDGSPRLEAAKRQGDERIASNYSLLCLASRSGGRMLPQVRNHISLMSAVMRALRVWMSAARLQRMRQERRESSRACAHCSRVRVKKRLTVSREGEDLAKGEDFLSMDKRIALG